MPAVLVAGLALVAGDGLEVVHRHRVEQAKHVGRQGKIELSSQLDPKVDGFWQVKDVNRPGRVIGIKETYSLWKTKPGIVEKFLRLAPKYPQAAHAADWKQYQIFEGYVGLIFRQQYVRLLAQQPSGRTTVRDDGSLDPDIIIAAAIELAREEVQSSSSKKEKNPDR